MYSGPATVSQRVLARRVALIRQSRRNAIGELVRKHVGLFEQAREACGPVLLTEFVGDQVLDLGMLWPRCQGVTS